jgi:hypothetical protein
VFLLCFVGIVIFSYVVPGARHDLGRRHGPQQQIFMLWGTLLVMPAVWAALGWSCCTGCSGRTKVKPAGTTHETASLRWPDIDASNGAAAAGSTTAAVDGHHPGWPAPVPCSCWRG